MYNKIVLLLVAFFALSSASLIVTDPVTDEELGTLSEELWALETQTNNVYSLIQVDKQGQTTSESTDDRAPDPLLTVDPEAYTGNTISKLIALHDNYESEISIAEDVTPAEIAEENAFIDAIFETPIMQKAQEFLIAKGFPNGKENFHEIWFSLYENAGSRVLGSSGFEQSFMTERTPFFEDANFYFGLNNWILFAKYEAAGIVNYRGWVDTIDLGSHGMIIKYNRYFEFEQLNPYQSMFIGSSPEFELAIYTVCFYARPGSNVCPIVLNGRPVTARTGSKTVDGKVFVGDAFVDIPE